MRVVLSTFDDLPFLKRLAEQVVRDGLAACVNILDTRSVYMWNSTLEKTQEHLAIFKTSDDRVERLKAKLAKLHPYDVPEIVELDVSSVNTPYLDWINSS